ncbi:MAG: heme-binding domain-containing protein [Ignavibacteriales bacterium]|nr:heme-binding domain-containing protein [Ignavibacteriales bacterium]MCB9217940.1 heme-binding domain-containing protein [Ignavibacteriales bacterium]MCB9260329.1 heme-binding domain-containing protein [Ignavibacteriales bacterium]
MKKVILIVIGIFVVIQFFTIDKTNPTSDPQQDFIAITNPPVEIGSMIKSSCYDCHSYHTKYPWYSNVAPVSWLLKSHVNDGRNHLNFSIWPDYKEAKKEHKVNECIEVINSGEMPMKGYVMLHSEAELSDAQRNQLVGWLESIKDSL